MTFDYVRDGAEIYRRSFATIRAEAALGDLPGDVARCGVRMIHSCGMTDLVDGSELESGRVGAWAAGGVARRPLDGSPVRARRWSPPGSPRSRLPADNEIVCTLGDPRVSERLADDTGDHAVGGGPGHSGGSPGRAQWSRSATPRPRCCRLLELLDAGLSLRSAAVLGLPRRLRRAGGRQGVSREGEALVTSLHKVAAVPGGCAAARWSRPWPRAVRSQCNRERGGRGGELEVGTALLECRPRTGRPGAGHGQSRPDPELRPADVIAYHSCAARQQRRALASRRLI